ncbi:OmpP1/FadL family transporter [Pseudoroseicyclus sp. CXY001]|uniref:OmpP1/FadL family transporter n=1 Tax=Pseudoroseicyclus sp. CXY001 TaxID=3242492 RepID=UPI00358DCC5A
MTHLHKSAAAVAALLAGAAPAFAGGLDRTGIDISPIFESGGYAELSYGLVMPDVSGQIGGVLSSGNMLQDYSQYSFALKTDIGTNLSFGIIIDTPYGAGIDYSDADPGYPVDAVGTISSVGVTALGRYRLNENFAVHAGARMVTADGTLTMGAVTTDFAPASGTGYLVGASYEIPDIALRAALTYASAISMSHETTGIAGAGVINFGPTEYEFPQSVSLDVQTGIAANTLLMAGVRWSDWTETDIDIGQTGTDLIDYSNDVYTYSLGVGYRFSEAFAASATVRYEASNELPASNLDPTDGRIGLSVGGTYTVGNAEITAGVNYTRFGDTTAEFTNADFSGNHSLAYGLSLGFRF